VHIKHPFTQFYPF